ncbi:MAG TPA: hypothetical protein VHX44_14845, partial [Planctomycetota bacterium]|nr:hypothetical protein [Planctomycetota bacterium]
FLSRIKELRDFVCAVKDGCFVCSIPDLNRLANYYWLYQETVDAGTIGTHKGELESAVRQIATAIKDTCQNDACPTTDY